MIGLHIAPLAGAAAQPWRNGGGLTHELLTWPPASDDWALRVSVAQIDEAGPFSAFPGIERWFAVVQGDGVRLQFDGRHHDLRPHGEPVSFDGAAAPRCTLLGGTTLDLNLMLRRSAGSGAMQRAQTGAGWRCPAEWRALYCNGPGRLQVDGQHAAELAAAALVWHPYAGDRLWTFETAAADTLGWWLSFQPRDEALP